MKTQEQIKEMLASSLSDLIQTQEWEKKARESYQQQCKIYGSADLGEVNTASEQVNWRKGEIEALKWVLS